MRNNIIEVMGGVLLRGGAAFLVAGLCACGSGSSTSQAGDVAPIPIAQKLSHTGPWFTDEQGRVVIIHGTNMINKLPPYTPSALGFGDKDLSFLAANGFNGIRLGFIWAGVEPNPGQYDDGYIESIAAQAVQAESHGLIPVVDFHQDFYSETYGGDGAPAWASIGSSDSIAFDNFWTNAKAPDGIGLEDHFYAAWQHVADRLKGDTHIVFEPYNEPAPGSADLATCAPPAGCAQFDINRLAPFYQKVLQAIRQVDSTRLVMVEPTAFFDLGMPTSLPGMNDPQVGFAFHDYCVLSLLHIPLPPGPCDRIVAVPLSNARSNFNLTGESNLLDEFGANDSPDVIAGLLSQGDQQMLSWMHWAYWAQDRGKPQTYGLLTDISAGPYGSNVQEDLLYVLAMPSPRVIAGTPQSWNWNSSTSTFKAGYSIARADGEGSFAAGAISEFFVHPRYFPSGYQVQVTGGKVTSPAGATWLTIAALPGAAEVSLSVTPAALH